MSLDKTVIIPRQTDPSIRRIETKVNENQDDQIVKFNDGESTGFTVDDFLSFANSAESTLQRQNHITNAWTLFRDAQGDGILNFKDALGQSQTPLNYQDGANPRKLVQEMKDSGRKPRY